MLITRGCFPPCTQPGPFLLLTGAVGTQLCSGTSQGSPAGRGHSLGCCFCAVCSMGSPALLSLLCSVNSASALPSHAALASPTKLPSAQPTHFLTFTLAVSPPPQCQGASEQLCHTSLSCHPHGTLSWPELLSTEPLLLARTGVTKTQTPRLFARQLSLI